MDEADALAYAETVGAYHGYTSAKTGRGVEEIFLQLTKNMLKSHKAAGGSRASMARGRRASTRGFVKIVDSTEPEDKGGCC